MTGSTSGVLTFGPSPYTPVGSILGPGSSGVVLTERERQVAELIALGFSYKRIAQILTLSGKAGVAFHVSAIAQRIPGQGKPQQKVTAWMWTYGAEQNGHTVG